MRKIYLFLYCFLFIAIQPNSATVNKNAVLLNLTTNAIIEGNQLTKKYNYTILINNINGEEYAEIELNSSKLDELSDIEAYITDINGVIIKKLSKKQIKTKSAFYDITFYSDLQIKEFELKNPTYPYILHYSYTRKSKQFFYIEYWSPILNPQIQTVNAEFNLTVPTSYKFNSYSANVPDCKKDSTTNSYTFSWKTSYTPTSFPNTKFVDIHQKLPYLKVVPVNFLYELPGQQDEWINFGDWEYKINKTRESLPESEKQTIDKLTTGVKNNIDKLKILYKYLQKTTRYINVNIETGGLVPYPASYVAERKYGDCKALSNYFKAVLAYAGIESFYTDVYAGDYIKPIIRDFPSQQFNHVILSVPIEKDTFWVDCTSKNPFGYISTFIQGRDAFLVKEHGSHFVHIPALNATATEQNRTINISEDNENALVDVTNVYRGDEYESLLYWYNNKDEENIKEFVRGTLTPPENSLLKYEIIAPADTAKYITLRHRTNSHLIFKKYDKDILISTIPLDIPVVKSFTEPFDVKVNIPIYKTDKQIIKVASEFLNSAFPENNKITSEFGEYSVEFSKDTNAIVLKKIFKLYAGNYEPEKSAAFVNFLKQVYQSENGLKLYITLPNN